ncbi:hypothetical protein A5N78_13475 [Prescottella equi]|uniref:hypothetical protein n=1 Tax=Rhodococcus hoagii TaxID=43767 RepID=UPI000A10610E|nr:hypothetical protein [Prescottella equi]ORL31571.1 hypothetical protein A6I91_18135 [Prescottella equi]ORL88299.1 hypothetical protein A5N78_13475 [Prescottella equi]ORM16114.1 hypothetical protein A5N70_14205 [Prescottella equi]
MSLPRSSAALAAFAGAACLAFAPTASAATTYTVTVVPPIGTVFSSTITTLAVVVGPAPSGADATTPVTLALTEPDGDTTSFTVPLTLGGATQVVRVHEAGRYTAVATFAPPSGETATTTVEFDVTPSPFGFGSAS